MGRAPSSLVSARALVRTRHRYTPKSKTRKHVPGTASHMSGPHIARAKQRAELSEQTQEAIVQRT
eukprot:3145862-Rhodomonas_salina.2